MGFTRAEAKKLGLGHLLAPVKRKKDRPLPEPPRPYAGWPGSWTLEIPGWRPVLASELKCHPLRAARLKKRDVRAVMDASVILGIPPAFTRRRVTLAITNHFTTYPDDDAPWKSTLDALKVAGMLVDDSREWCEVVYPPVYMRGEKGTVITLEDVEAYVAT
jgi:Holliday junction resolvase RusA-like endonuclease